ncbi:MAG: flagellar hook basal-body protein [Pseudomonadaceae bacterium]|nr:flagellar hook basal-body protein [Pseudomonadaceae bacterium]
MQELAILASRAMTTMRKFNAVSDNIANINTDGYRRKDYEFKELVSRPDGINPTASYVGDRAVIIDYSDGVLTETGNPFNAAIGGEGFFAVDVNGTTQYTRRGHFLMATDGTLVTPEGHPVLDNSGGQIQLPPDTTQVIIGRDGSIATEQGQIGRLGVFGFSDEDKGLLQRAGNTGFIPTQGASAQPLENPVVYQGKIEASNVSPVMEMVTMQDVARSYQSAVRALRGLEDTEQRAIRTLAPQ